MATFKAFPVINQEATGANIQKLRKSRGYSVADLQEYFGFDAPQAIYKWQRGETLPSTDNLLALGHLLDVPIEKILVFQMIGENDAPQDNSCGDHSSLALLFNGTRIPDRKQNTSNMPDDHISADRPLRSAVV